MTDHLNVVILAGGKGKRLWPESRENKPKQFMDLLHTGKSSIQYTYERFARFLPASHIHVVATKEFHDLVRQQLPDIPDENIFLEPFQKDTAVGVTYSALKLAAKDPEAAMIIAPSDQMIMDLEEFEKICRRAYTFIETNNAIITLGIQPTFPNTHYGYIQRGQAEFASNVYKVKTFTEKPPLDMAQAFITSGDFLWNAGIFIWKAANVLNELEKYEPEMFEIFEEYKPLIGTEEESAAVSKIYSQCSNISLDLAIMEKTENVYVIPCNPGWADLGTWNNLYDEMEKDSLGNAIRSDNVLVVDATKCIINVPPKKVAVIQGLDNHIVIDTEDVLLICQKDKEDEIKDYMAEVKRKFGNEYF